MFATYPEYFVIALLVITNSLALVIMLVDKRRSMQNGDIERIPEGILFFLATVGGSIGISAGMLLLRHKTRKWYFQIGIPLLILQNGATLILLLHLINE
jgi:uncharacterized membrane protein YsdA (DUF1294 family)